MKNILFIILVIFSVSGCGQLKNNDQKPAKHNKYHSADELLTAADAEKILGTSPNTTESFSHSSEDSTLLRSSHISLFADSITEKTGALYFLYRSYRDISKAKKLYSSTKKANANHGIKTLNDMGDEAYFHSDNENFYFVMIRKGNQVVVMKLNKITSTTSLNEFNRVAKKIADSL